MSQRPLLFLDVDGVVSPFGGGPPPGYRRTDVDGYQVTWRPSQRRDFAMLVQLFDVVWATTWEHRANEAISPLLGLPRLPVVEFGTSRSGDTWKLAKVAERADDRPLAWVDDELFADARAWAEQREPATLLLRPSSSVGLTDEHFAELQAFGRAMAERASS